MADSIILSDGTTDIQLVKDTATHDYQWKYGMRVGGRPPRPLWHIPDNSPPQIVRLVNDTQEISFGLQVYPSDDSWDTAINDLNTIKRWIDGDDQQAARYHTSGDVNKIYLRVQLDGMTNYTDWTILYGNVDDSISFYQDAALLNKRILSVNITLTCEPVGNGASFTLRNDLPSSPHFLEDSDSDGLADGMNLIGTPTTSIATSNWLFGGQSQRCDTDTSTSEGIRTDTATATISSNIVAKCFVAASGGDLISMRLLDGSNNEIETKQFNPTTPASSPDAWAKTHTAGGGSLTWYEYHLTGTNSSAAGAKLQVWRSSLDATQTMTFFVDGLFVMVGETVVPDGWCSTSAIQNRYDPTSSAEGRINYVDVWGIPGDVPALVDITATVGTVASFPYRMHVSRISDGKNLSAGRLYWFDTLTAGGVISGSYSTVSDANRSGGSYLRYTSTGSGSAIFTISIPNVAAFNRWPSRIFALTRSSNTASTIGQTGETRYGYTTVSTWEWVDIGLELPTDRPWDDIAPSATATKSFTVNATTTGVTIDIDAIVMIPVEDDGFLIGESTSYTANDTIYLIADLEHYVVVSGTSGVSGTHLGECWTAKTSNTMNRYIFNVAGVGNVHALTNTYSVSLGITPRTRHLLGTL